jgi:hypothetical protein
MPPRLSADESRIVIPPPIVIAGALSSTGFAIALISGLFAGQAAAEILGGALVALVVCHVIGYAAGRAALVAIDERVAQHKAGRPLVDPLSGAPSQTGAEAPIEVGELVPANEEADRAHSS